MQEPDEVAAATSGSSSGPTLATAREAEREAARNDLLLTVYCRRHLDLVAYAHSITGCPEDAGDLVQEVYAQMSKLVPEDQPLHNPFAFLCGCLRRLARNLRIRDRRQLFLLERWTRSPSGSDPTDQLEARLLSAEILNKLIPADARLLCDKFYEGRTARQLADTLGISEGTVRKRLQRALDKAGKIADSCS